MILHLKQGDTLYGLGEIQRVQKRPITVEAIKMDNAFTVEIEGIRAAGKPGDYLIRGVKGDLYPCDAEVFEASYDPVEAGNETTSWE